MITITRFDIVRFLLRKLEADVCYDAKLLKKT